jgi:hypothetical protein
MVELSIMAILKMDLCTDKDFISQKMGQSTSAYLRREFSMEVGL